MDKIIKTKEELKRRNETQKRYYQRNKEYYKKKNKEDIHKKYQWKKKNPDKVREGWLKSKYGITLDQYNQMLTSQGGVCAICGQPETQIDGRTGKILSLSVDHNHKTGKIRQLLCKKHNQLVVDDPDLALKLYQYSLKWNNQNVDV